MAACRMWFSLLVIFVFIVSTANTSCPFSNKNQDKKETIKGHNKPFGHHAKHWKRIHTVYEHPDPETFYNNFVRTSTPLVIKGGAADWPAIKKWTNTTYISELGGKERSTVNWKKIYGYDRHHAIRIDMTMKEFIEKFNHHDLYMDATIQAGLHDDVYWPYSLGCQFFLKRVKQLAIMMNNGKSRSDVHIDVTDTYFMQATGKRLWLLSPPTNVTNIYSGHPSLVDHSGISILNQTHVDLEKHQHASKLDIYAAYLNPGDIVYVPEAWYHQVVTYDAPNIAIVAFLNVLFCEYNTNASTDRDHVKRCVNDVLQKKPKALKCNAFPREPMTITQMLKRYKPRTMGAFKGFFGTPDTVGRFRRSSLKFKDGTKLPKLGMSLAGMSQEALKKGLVLRQGIFEGFRLFCTAPNDGSEEALGQFIRKSGKKNIRKKLQILSYLPIHGTRSESVNKFIEASLKRLNTTYIDIVLLSAPYCVPDYNVGTCTRNDYQQAWTDDWKALEALQRKGIIRYLGVSDFSLEELKQLKKVAKIPITIARARFDLYFRNKKYRKYCKENNIHFMGRSVLGRRWKDEQPNFPANRDIFKEYQLQRSSYQYKISIHAAVYDWAIKKNVIVCPRVNDRLHVRVNVKAIDSESMEQVSDIESIDQLDRTDKDGIIAPEARDNVFTSVRRGDKTENDGSRPEENEEEIDEEEVGEEEDEQPVKNVKAGDREGDFRGTSQKENPMNPSLDYSNKIYTDDQDYDRFPAYMLGK